MRVLIADDHDLLRDVFEAWFRKENIEVAAVCDLDHAINLVADAEPFDLILLDYQMPGMNGLLGLARMMRDAKGARVALMSGNAPRDVVQGALDQGAAGFVPKTMPPRSLVAAVAAMARGERYVPDDPAGDKRAQPSGHPIADLLSPREITILGKLCEGKGDVDIARDLGLGEPTVRLHLKTLCRKIGAATLLEATAFARRASLF